jgi:hypothetical protein
MPCTAPSQRCSHTCSRVVCRHNSQLLRLCCKASRRLDGDLSALQRTFGVRRHLRWPQNGGYGPFLLQISPHASWAPPCFICMPFLPFELCWQSTIRVPVRVLTMVWALRISTAIWGRYRYILASPAVPQVDSHFTHECNTALGHPWPLRPGMFYYEAQRSS